MPNQYTALPTREERAAATEGARRRSRYKFAESRIRKLAETDPPFTEDERRELAALLMPPEPVRR